MIINLQMPQPCDFRIINADYHSNYNIEIDNCPKGAI
jgi:hypothetical protein